MTREEFSSGFDTLLDSYSIDNAITIEVNEYEKSFFLTQVQQALVKELYDNHTGTLSYECDERTRRQLESLVITSNPDLVLGNNNPLKASRGFYHTIYKIPEDCWYIVYEEVDINGYDNCGSVVSEVLPVTHDDYTRIVRNPFRGPTSTRVLRLDKGNGELELVSQFTLIEEQEDEGKQDKYLIRYIKKPKPIILEKMSIDVSIDGAEPIYDTTTTPQKIVGYKAQDCELPEQLHWEILQAAVQLAITTKTQYNSKS